MPKRKTPPPSISADPVTAWATAVVAGEIIAGPHVRNACRRHLLDLKEGPQRGLRWDLDAALRAIEFCPDVLRLAGGQFEGRPFELQPSQKFKTGSLFGWKRADGTRRFRGAYIEEAKGAGKSPWAASIGMYCLVADGEPRAEVYAAASKKDQAMRLRQPAASNCIHSQIRIGAAGFTPKYGFNGGIRKTFMKSTPYLARPVIDREPVVQRWYKRSSRKWTSSTC